MNLFMPAERVLYDRAYYLSDEAEKDYAFEVAEEHGVDVGEVLYSDELMKEVRNALDRDIDLYLDDEIANFDSMLRELKCGDGPEHPAEISVVAMGSVGRWDVPSRGLVAANSLRDLIDGKGSADALVDCQIDRIVDTNGTFSIEASHHDGTAYLDVRLISGVSFDGKGFRLGGERYAPGKMDLDDFHILLGNLYDVSDVGPCSLPHFAERAYGAAQKSYRFGETVFDIYCETSGTDKPYKVMVSAGELAFIEAAPEGLRDDYPTPVHVFTYDGRDSEPVHRTDVHLDGDAMTLDPVKGATVRNGADTGYRQLDSDFVNASICWDEVYGFIKRSDPNVPGMPASFDYALLALDSNGWHFGESSASAFDIPVKDLDFFLGIFYCSSISEFATYASECNEPDFQEWLCSMYLRDQVEDRLRHEISCNCIQSTVDAFKLLSDKIGFAFEPENNPANVAKAASAAAGRSVGSGLSGAGGIKH